MHRRPRRSAAGARRLPATRRLLAAPDKRRGDPSLNLAPHCGARSRKPAPWIDPRRLSPPSAGDPRQAAVPHACGRGTGTARGPRPPACRAPRARALRRRTAGLQPPHPEHRAQRPGVSRRVALPRPAATGPRGLVPAKPTGTACAALPDRRPHRSAGPRHPARRGGSPCTVEAGHRVREAIRQLRQPSGGRRAGGAMRRAGKSPPTNAGPARPGIARRPSGQRPRQSSANAPCTRARRRRHDRP